jgi:alkylation response protein AidB-like acyl-CoA dehydrogenase
VPRENLLGEPGQGFKLGMARITMNRILHCATMIGLARRALRHASEHAQARRQFGRAIGDFQAIQHMLADMHTELYAARSMVGVTAARFDAGEKLRAEASMCKLFCSETAFGIADRAVQIHGGEGLIQGHPVEWIFRMLRMFRILTGTSEIQRNTIAKSLQALHGTSGET